MPYSRRHFLLVGCLGGLAATTRANGCAISWASPIGLDAPDAPRPTKDTIDTFLDQEFGQGQWRFARDEHLTIQSPPVPENHTVIPLTIFLPSAACSRLSVFLESHVPYHGKKWSHALLYRKVETDEIRPSRYLMVRRKILAFTFPDDGISKVSARFRAMRADYRLIVAAELKQGSGKRSVFVHQSTVSKVFAPHCGGVYFVDTQNEAETTSCAGYADDFCPGDSWGAR